MKVLIVYTASGVSDNPFVRLLADGIRAAGCEVVCSVEEFRRNATAYDVVHFQWPEELFRWKNPSHEEVGAFERQLAALKERGIPIVYTRHNTQPHHGNRLVARAYALLEKQSDAVVHLGDYSRREFLAAHPDSTQVQAVIPHHIYDGMYDASVTRPAGRKALGIQPERIVILAFGAFRHKSERRLVWRAFRRLRCTAKFLLAPRLWPYSKNGFRKKGIRKFAERILYYAGWLVEGLFDSRITTAQPLVADSELPYYFAAANVVFIQRTDILNSGNVPLALSFGRVVVGPATGNIGELLAQTGNPSFDPADPKSVSLALELAVRLAGTDKGAENRAYAEEHFSTARIANMYKELYERLHGGK